MILRKIRPLRPGTARYSIGGVPGLDDDDRAVVSVWPREEGGVTVLVKISGSINTTITVPLIGRSTPQTITADDLRPTVEALLSRIHTATWVDKRLPNGVG